MLLQMSGNAINEAFFLDSCVYINYGVVDDLFHNEAVVFF